MARLRTIKPEFWVSEQIAECSTSARLAFIGIWNFCDDRGVHPAKPRTLKAELFPMDDITADQVGEWVDELIHAGLLAAFTAEGDEYWVVTGWAKHQKIDRPSYKHPQPPQNSTHPRRTFDEASPSATPRSGVESSGVESSGCMSPSPTTRPQHGGMAKEGQQTTKQAKARKSAMPADFSASDRVKAWAVVKGFDRLDQHLEVFKAKVAANGYAYADWDAAFMEAIRQDWARLRQSGAQEPFSGSPTPAPQWALDAGFQNRFEAENAGCTERNHKHFANGQKKEAA